MRNCEVCRRPRQQIFATDDAHFPCFEKVKGGKVYFVHDGYGCDSGCCGHRIYIDDANGGTIFSEFEFIHNEQALKDRVGEIAQRLGIEVGTCEFIDD